MTDLRRGAVRVTADAGPPISPVHTVVEVWTGAEWVRVGGVARIDFRIAASPAEPGTLELTVYPHSVSLNADRGQIVIREVTP